MTDPGETKAATADPGKAWRRSHGIPVVGPFDGYRALAVYGIASYHALSLSGTWAKIGDSVPALIVRGIPATTLTALFIVSGFVIYLPTVVGNGDFGSKAAFAIRRAARLFPAYYVALVVALVLLATVLSSHPTPDVGTVAAHFLCLQAPALLLINDFPLGLGVIAPVWTLSLEIGFYIVLPFVAASYFRRPFVGLAVAALIVTGWHLLAANSGDVASFLGFDLSTAAQDRIGTFYESQMPSYALAFAGGMTGAWVYVAARERWGGEVLERIAARAAIVSSVAVLVAMYFAGRDLFTNLATAHRSLGVELGLPVALVALMVCVALGSKRLQWPVANRPIRWLGDISYAVFLIHFAVIVVLQELSFPGDGGLGAALAWTGVVLFVSTVYAYLSARFVERPVRRWAHRYGRRATTSARPAAAA